MIYIAHRGLLTGPSKELENSPEQILAAISLGFDCELDLWLVDNSLILGHDSPQYIISEDWLMNPHMWIHAKNIEALHWLSSHPRYKFNYFWHESDQYTMTSTGYIWTYPGRELTPRSVMVLPELIDNTLHKLDSNCYAICSDFVEVIKNMENHNENSSMR